MDSSYTMSEYELIWSGPCDMSGYGIATMNYALGLSRGGIRTQLVNRSHSQGLEGKGLDEGYLNSLESLYKTEVTKTAVRVQQQVPDRLSRVDIAKANIGYTIFEMTSVPKGWVGYCDAMDQIWTGSKYSRQAFIKAGLNPDKISVIPHIIDSEMFNPNVKPIVLPQKAAWNFVSVFDFQSRKAWRELLLAYTNAFRPNEDVCLWLKCFRHGFTQHDQIAMLTQIYKFFAEMKIKNPPRIEVCPFDLPYSLMPSFYNAFDCYVSISREGFGLPYAEAGACGLTIIGPEVGGTREYLHEHNSYLVKYLEDVPVDQEMLAIDQRFIGLKWARHSVEDLSDKMRYVFEHQKEAREKGLKARETVQSFLHYSAITEKVKTQLDMLRK